MWSICRRTVSYNNYILKSALQKAIDIEPPILLRNPAKQTVLPKQEKTPKDVLEFEEFAVLREANEKTLSICSNGSDVLYWFA